MRALAARREKIELQRQADEAQQSPVQELYERAHALLYTRPPKPGMLEIAKKDYTSKYHIYRSLASATHEIDDSAFRLTSRLEFVGKSLFIADFVAVEELRLGYRHEVTVRGKEYANAYSGTPRWQLSSWIDQRENPGTRNPVFPARIGNLSQRNWQLKPYPTEDYDTTDSTEFVPMGKNPAQFIFKPPILRLPLSPEEQELAQSVITTLIDRVEAESRK